MSSYFSYYLLTYFFVIITHRPSQELDTQPFATSVTFDNFPFLWSFTLSPFSCTRIQLTAVPSILSTISLIRIAAYESRQNLSCFAVWHSRLWSFQGRDTKLEKFLHKNQHTQRKFLNFENWTKGEPHSLAKIRVLYEKPK